MGGLGVWDTNNKEGEMTDTDTYIHRAKELDRLEKILLEAPDAKL